MDDADPPEGPLIIAIRGRRSLEEIRTIVEADPSLLRRRWRGDLPLHHAVQGRSSRPGVVRYLLEQYPESVREWSFAGNDDRWRRLSIHLAVARRSVDYGDDTVRVLVEARPEFLRERDSLDSLGRFPLQEALNEDDIRILHQAYPEAIDEPDKNGMLALHRAVREDYPLPYLQLLTALSPSSVRVKDNRGRIPLHCIGQFTRVGAARHLVQLWEDSVHQLDDEGCLPLHHATCRNSEIVLFLVGQAPGTVRVRNKEGSLPLHLALVRQGTDERGTDERGTDERVIRTLLGAWTESVRETTLAAKGGFLPLHFAAQNDELDIVQLLVESFPESVRERTATGWLAIHLALKHPDDALYATARFLLDQFPESITEPTTEEGYLPLHVAAQSWFVEHRHRPGQRGQQLDQEVWVRMELGFLQFLVQRAPVAVRVASRDHLFPANYAIAEGNYNLGATQFLLQQYPEAILQRSRRGQNALHMAIGRDYPRPDIVQYIARSQPQMLHETDELGSTPLHAAVGSRRFTRDVGRGITRLLVESRAQSLGEVDRCGNLPLHVAVTSADLDMVRLLVEARPESVRATNKRGQLPLHRLLDSNPRNALPAVAFLVDQMPGSLQQSDAAGSLPIHVAVAQRVPSLPIVSFLVEQRPQTLLVADSEGSLPLHLVLAQARPCRLGLVQILVEKCPEALQRMDSKGNLPLMIAAASTELNLDVLFFLVTKSPGAMHRKGGFVVAGDATQPAPPLS